MANPDHLAVLNRGVLAWNEWRKANASILPDLRRAKLRLASLSEAVFDDTNLYRADLAGAVLRNSTFRGAVLGGADLTKADLSHANLGGAHLGRAILDGATLIGAQLRGTDLYSAEIGAADFTGADVGWVVFGNVDLRNTIGLETVHHAGPSTIGIDTIQRSHGRIPAVFLRGAGVTHDFITYSESLLSNRPEFSSCFISHSHEDQDFSDRLYHDLRDRDIRVWYFPEHATPGRDVWDEIDEVIKRFDKLIVVCSRHSLTSGPVIREIVRALDREDKELSEVVCPIRIDEYIFNGWQHARRLDVLQKVVADFSGWRENPAHYLNSLVKLVTALVPVRQRQD